jgi:hypothetical protein
MSKPSSLLLAAIISFSATMALPQSGRVKQHENGAARSAPASADSPLSGAYLLPKGTLIDLFLDKSLSSKTNVKDEEFIAKVSDPVAVDDHILLSPNTAVKCHIISVQPAAHKSHNGSITIGFDELLLDDGSKIPLHATLISVVERTDEVVDDEGEGKIKNPAKGKNAPVAVGTGAGVGATIGAISGGGAGAGIGGAIGAGAGLGSILLAKGKDVELLAGSRLKIKLDADIYLKGAASQ